MSYDYSSESARLEMPNPYRIQNRLLFACALVLVLTGLFCLMQARQTMAAVPIVVGIALLVAGIVSASTAAKRLRFFFGRGRPHSLAPDLQPTVAGTSPAAEFHKGLLRQGALAYPEPQGAVDGLLYHFVPHLITAPLAVQQQARMHFFNVAALVLTVISYAFAWLVFGNEATRPWLSIAYFAFGAVYLLRPIVSSSMAPVSMTSLVLLVAAAILGPALLGMVGRSLPDLHGWSLSSQTAIMLLVGLVGVLLSMLAVLGQVQPPPATQTSSEQLRLSLNVPPSLLLDELERHLQEQWVERIPNRRYSREVPVIHPDLHSGPFAGELFEETQPMPMAGATPAGIGQALASARHRWVVALDLYASLLVLAGAVMALMFTHQFSAAEDGTAGTSFSFLGISSILLVMSSFCFKAASRLWGRFDFESVLVWVELNGTYQTASIGTGNMLNSRVQTSNQIVRTESMTLRIWRARIESVVFGKDGLRQVTAMFSSDAGAKELAAHLAEFGQGRASLVAPGSQADAERLRALGSAEQALGSPAAGSLLLGAQAGTKPAAAALMQARFCHACGSALAADSRFCGQCGAPVDAAGSQPG